MQLLLLMLKLCLQYIDTTLMQIKKEFPYYSLDHDNASYQNIAALFMQYFKTIIGKRMHTHIFVKTFS